MTSGGSLVVVCPCVPCIYLLGNFGHCRDWLELVLLTKKLLQAVSLKLLSICFQRVGEQHWQNMSTSANQNIITNHSVFTDTDISYNLNYNEINTSYFSVLVHFNRLFLYENMSDLLYVVSLLV